MMVLMSATHGSCKCLRRQDESGRKVLIVSDPVYPLNAVMVGVITYRGHATTCTFA
jgi:hypothetical protein